MEFDTARGTVPALVSLHWNVVHILGQTGTAIGFDGPTHGVADEEAPILRRTAQG